MNGTCSQKVAGNKRLITKKSESTKVLSDFFIVYLSGALMSFKFASEDCLII